MKTVKKIKKSFRAGPLTAALPAISSAFSVLSAVKGLFNKTPKATTPEVSTPTVMPTQDSAAVLDAKRKALIAQSQKGGRASTVLSDSETFGGN